MANSDELDLIYKRILGLEMISRLKICGLRWDKLGPNQYSTSFDEDSHFWKVHLTKTSFNIVLDFRRDALLYFSINSEEEPSIDDFFKEISFDSSAMDAIMDFQSGTDLTRCEQN